MKIRICKLHICIMYYICNMNFLFKVHTYLFYTIVACMFTSVFEMIYINDVRPALARAAFTLLQGTWFYQVCNHCNHPWPLRVFGFRFISAYDSYIIWGHSMTIWTRRVGRWSKQSLFLSTFRVKNIHIDVGSGQKRVKLCSRSHWMPLLSFVRNMLIWRYFSKCLEEMFSSHWGWKDVWGWILRFCLLTLEIFNRPWKDCSKP